MQYFVYIGRHNKTIELFSKLSTGVFYAAPNCKHSIKGIPFNLGTVEVPKLSFVKKSFSI